MGPKISLDVVHIAVAGAVDDFAVRHPLVYGLAERHEGRCAALLQHLRAKSVSLLSALRQVASSVPGMGAVVGLAACNEVHAHVQPDAEIAFALLGIALSAAGFRA
jgi:hypothetical protein